MDEKVLEYVMTTTSIEEIQQTVNKYGLQPWYQKHNSEEGEESRDGIGDLYVFLTVKQHNTFERKDYDLYLTTEISPSQATLGTEIEVPTLKESVKIKIPSGTQSGTIFKITDKGIQYLNSREIGDLFVKIKVNIPKKLSSKEKDLYEELAKLNKEKVNFKKGFFEKLFL